MANKNPLKNVDIDSLVTINVYRGKPTPFDKNPFIITVDPINVSLRVVFDEGALKKMNEKLSERVVKSDSTNPNTIMFMKEFVHKMVSEFYRNGLMILEPIPEPEKDPYAKAKKAIKI